MAIHKPIVLIEGELSRLPAGDEISGASGSVAFSGTNGGITAMTMGQPVYVSGADAVSLAQANAIATAKVVGLVKDASAAAGAAANVQHSGVLEVMDWTTVTGSASLTPGARYYLDAVDPGKLVEIAPNATGEYVIAIGRALSATEMLIEIDSPIGA